MQLPAMPRSLFNLCAAGIARPRMTLRDEMLLSARLLRLAATPSRLYPNTAQLVTKMVAKPNDDVPWTERVAPQTGADRPSWNLQGTGAKWVRLHAFRLLCANGAMAPPLDGRHPEE